MIDRDIIISRAIDECVEEMFLKAQPSVSLKELVEKVKSGEIEDSRENPIYTRHYLSQKEFEYIKNKYAEAYDLKPHWTEHIKLLEEYLMKGGHKDFYVPETMEEDGSIHPGYRSYKEVKSLKEQLKTIIIDDKKVDEVVNLVMSNIKDCKEYYRFDRDYQQFAFSVCLGCSPTSNKETVEKYWESQGTSITIEERNPLLLWDMDYYGSEFEEAMQEEYGDNWKEFWQERLKEKLEEERLEREAKQKEWENYKLPPKFKIGDLVRSKDDPTAREVFAIQPEGYRVIGDFIPFNEESKWYHCYEQFKNYL